MDCVVRSEKQSENATDSNYRREWEATGSDMVTTVNYHSSGSL